MFRLGRFTTDAAERPVRWVRDSPEKHVMVVFLIFQVRSITFGGRLFYTSKKHWCKTYKTIKNCLLHLVVNSNIFLDNTPVRDRIDTILKSKGYVRNGFSISEAMKRGHVTHVENINSLYGYDFYDPHCVCVRHYLRYRPGTKITTNNDPTGGVHYLVLKRFDHPTIVSDRPVWFNTAK